VAIVPGVIVHEDSATRTVMQVDDACLNALWASCREDTIHLAAMWRIIQMQRPMWSNTDASNFVTTCAARSSVPRLIRATSAFLADLRLGPAVQPTATSVASSSDKTDREWWCHWKTCRSPTARMQVLLQWASHLTQQAADAPIDMFLSACAKSLHHPSLRSECSDIWVRSRARLTTLQSTSPPAHRLFICRLAMHANETSFALDQATHMSRSLSGMLPTICAPSVVVAVC
jgi:hypothetical protein